MDEHWDEVDHRLGRIEDSQALLSEAVATLTQSNVKIAESVIQIENLKRDEARHYSAINRIHERVDALEQEQARHSVYVGLLSGALGAVITTVASLAINLFLP